MKIDPSKINEIRKQVSKEKIKFNDSSDFEKHLGKATGSKSEVNNEKAIKILEMSGTAPLFLSNVSFDKEKAVKTIEKILSGLDLYKNALDNENINYPQMESLISNINMEKDMLLGQVNELPHDEPLRNIANETAILVLNESNKYFSSLV